MEQYTIDSQILDDIAWDNMEFEEKESYELYIITGNTGVGKTEIIKQYLSRSKGNKLYIEGYLNFNLNILNNYISYIVVFDDVENLTVEILKDFIKSNRVHSPDAKILILFQDYDKAFDFKLGVEKFLEMFDIKSSVFLNVKPNYMSDYLRASTIYSSKGVIRKGPNGTYWGKESITTIN